MKKIIVPIIAAAAVAGVLFLAGRLLEPKYMHGIVEGALTAEYYEEELPHDVIFIGDCEVYENFSPMTLWEEYGITSYIRGSAQQLIWQSYYLLRDALRTEKPKAVVFNVLSMKYGEPQKEAYNRMTIDGMRMSRDKVDCIKASMTEDEQMLDYLIPLLRYHSRWSELTADDVKYMFRRDKIGHNGYYMRTDVKPAGTFPKEKKLSTYDLPANAYKYLDMITSLCEEEGIELILIKAPSLYPAWYDEWDVQMKDYAAEHGLKYINFLELTEDVGIDFNEDTYDGGLHLNVYGAEKMSRYFGRILKDECSVPDRRGEENYEKVYKEKLDRYYDMRNDPDAMGLYKSR